MCLIYIVPVYKEGENLIKRLENYTYDLSITTKIRLCFSRYTSMLFHQIVRRTNTFNMLFLKDM